MSIWTAQDDHTLLVKILEAHPNLTIDADAVSNMWPGELVKRTPRAIKDRIGKIKNMSGKSLASKNSSGFKSISNGVRSTQTEDQDQATTNVHTPEKLNFLHSRFSTSYATSSGATNGSNKRQRRAAFSEDEEEAHSSSGSDTDDPERFSGKNNSPSKTKSSEKMRLRAVSSRKYTIDQADSSSDEDVASKDGDSEDADGEFDPDLEYEKENQLEEKRVARFQRRQSGSTTM